MLDVLPPDAIDRRNLQDPSDGKGFIMHSVRGFIQEMTKGLFDWSTKRSIWPLTFGIKCCAIEMMAFGASRFDSDRLGVFFRASPRQADLLIIAGPATIKLKDVITRLYDQMPRPKYVIAFGECAICGGPFWDSYSIINGVDKIIPVDIYVPGCPPRPEQLLLAIMKLQEKIDEESKGKRARRTEVVGMPSMSREELLAQVMAHPTFAAGHQSDAPRPIIPAEQTAAATPTGQPADNGQQAQPLPAAPTQPNPQTPTPAPQVPCGNRGVPQQPPASPPPQQPTQTQPVQEPSATPPPLKKEGVQ